jgi:N-formylmaleamate deformylase
MFQDIAHNRITANGTSFNYYRTPASSKTNESGKPILVLQHGFSDNGLCWWPTSQELAADYDIIMPDARGHGLSARVSNGETFDQVEDLAALMRALGVKKAVVGGHSMGAQIASGLGARFPELVTALVLEDPPWFLPRPDSQPGVRFAAPQTPLGQWLAGMKDKSLEQIIAENREEHPSWPEPYLRAWSQGKKELDLNFMTANSPRPDWQKQAACIQCPTLLITANPSLGGILNPETERLVMEKNPRIRVVNFPEAGHHIRFAFQDAYIQAVKAFLQEAG